MNCSRRLALRTTCAVLAFWFSIPAAAQTANSAYESIHPALSGETLLEALAADYAPRRVLGYGPARDSLYAYLQRTRGAVHGVYSGFAVRLTPGVDPSADAYEKGISAEHAWPQSRGADQEPQRSDLHALFPARVQVNSARANHPFAEIPDPETDGWYRLSQSQSHVPTEAIDEWSERDNAHPDPAYAGRFEPREARKGDVARALFYFAAVHAAVAEPGFLEAQLADLLRWHTADPPSPDEQARSHQIARWQGTPNPFVLDTTLARRAFQPGSTPPDETPSTELTSFTANPDGPGRALLEWTTASEPDDAGFAVEHRLPGASDFQEMTFMRGAGFTREPQRYAYRATGLSPGSHTFRLRLTGADERFTLSDERAVEVEETPRKPQLLVYPNPATGDAVTLYWWIPEIPPGAEVSISVYDALGRRVRRLEVRGQIGKALLESSVLASGLYLAQLTVGECALTVTRFVVAR